MNILTTAQLEAYYETRRKIFKGERAVVSNEFLDWLASTHHPLADSVRTIPNPDRVGILDIYIAYL